MQTLSNFPDHLLASIFLRCSPTASYEPIEVVLSQVCVRWRIIALGLPPLWTRIVLNCPPIHQEEVLLTYIQRSKVLPLELYIQASAHNTPWIGLVNLIKAHKNRWRAISIRLVSMLAFSQVTGTQFTTMDLPLLEHLSIKSQSYPADDEKETLADNPITLLPSSMRIKTLRLQTTGVAFFRLATENVTTLHLEQHHSGLRECPYLDILLRSFPSLVHLSLIGDFVRIGRPSVDHVIRARNLHSLRVGNSKTISNLLLSLSAPNLTSLTLKNLTFSSLQLFQSLYKPWEKDKFPLLQTLVLIRPQLSPETWKRLFSDFAGVTRLDLINCYGDEPLALLSEKNTELEMMGFQVPLPLPELETISLHHLKDVEHSLVQFLITRTQVIPKLRLHSNIQSGVFSILSKDICIQRWDVLEFWPAKLYSESEYRVFEDEYDWSMQILTKPPIERDVLYPPWTPPPEKDEIGWWKKFVSLMKEGFALCF